MPRTLYCSNTHTCSRYHAPPGSRGLRPARPPSPRLHAAAPCHEPSAGLCGEWGREGVCATPSRSATRRGGWSCGRAGARTSYGCAACTGCTGSGIAPRASSVEQGSSGAPGSWTRGTWTGCSASAGGFAPSMRDPGRGRSRSLGHSREARTSPAGNRRRGRRAPHWKGLRSDLCRRRWLQRRIPTGRWRTTTCLQLGFLLDE